MSKDGEERDLERRCGLSSEEGTGFLEKSGCSSMTLSFQMYFMASGVGELF